MTLYSDNPKRWAEIAAEGYPCVAEMAKHFETISGLEQALGYKAGAATKWIQGKNGISNHTEAVARAWLSRGVLPGQGASPTPKPASSDSKNTLLVLCDAAKFAKVQLVLTMLGCEVVEV